MPTSVLQDKSVLARSSRAFRECLPGSGFQYCAIEIIGAVVIKVIRLILPATDPKSINFRSVGSRVAGKQPEKREKSHPPSTAGAFSSAPHTPRRDDDGRFTAFRYASAENGIQHDWRFFTRLLYRFFLRRYHLRSYAEQPEYTLLIALAR